MALKLKTVRYEVLIHKNMDLVFLRDISEKSSYVELDSRNSHEAIYVENNDPELCGWYDSSVFEKVGTHQESKVVVE